MTTTQLDLFSAIEVPSYAPAMSLAERFDAFHADNPHVLRALEHLAREWFDAGHERVGVKALWEELRWQTGIQTGETPRLNNNWPAFYARLLIERNPSWATRIQTRIQRSAA